MRTETQTIRIGENMGPVDWSHKTAIGMPEIWKQAEKNPADYLFSQYERTILTICMYDGWPYWEPRPAIQHMGPMNSPEWKFFNSYGIHAGSIVKRIQSETKKERENSGENTSESDGKA